MNTYDYRIHPLAEMFPPLSPEEFQKLKADIAKNGQIEPIWINKDSILVDGRHRLQACKELGLQPIVQLFSLTGNEGLSEADFIWSRNILRRHLTDDQRAVLGHRWADAIRDAAKQRMKDGGKGLANPPNPLRTRETVAKKAGVSSHKVRQAERVAKYKPELLPKVESGDVKLKDAVKEAEAERVKLKRKGAADTVESIRRSHPERIVDVESQSDAFDEQAVLSRLYRNWEDAVLKNWPTNRKLTPVIRKVFDFAGYLEKLERGRAAELRKKVAGVGISVGAR